MRIGFFDIHCPYGIHEFLHIYIYPRHHFIRQGVFGSRLDDGLPVFDFDFFGLHGFYRTAAASLLGWALKLADT